MKVLDDDAREVRRPHRVPVRFGTERADQDAVTRDVSESGLFVLTETPLEPGTKVRLRLSLDVCSLPMRGVVAWNSGTETQAQLGMGVTLLRPPALYQHFVNRLK